MSLIVVMKDREESSMYYNLRCNMSGNKKVKKVTMRKMI